MNMTALANPTSGHDDSYADIVERMFREYEGVLDLPTITQIVNGCRHDLQGTPVGALPELTERLARHRLALLADKQISPTSPMTLDQ
jgi:hypothetical protein